MKFAITRSDEYVKAARIARGSNVPKIIEVDVQPAALAEETRRFIIELCGEYPDYLAAGLDSQCRWSRFASPRVPFLADIEIEQVDPPTVDRLVKEARARVAAQQAEYLEKVAEAEAEMARKRADKEVKENTAIAEFLADPAARPAGEIAYDGVTVGGVFVAKLNPQFGALKDEIKRRKALDTEQAEREKAEAEAARKAYFARWVQESGTESQKARFARGFLPEKEIMDAVREQVFAPLAEFGRYERITLDEVLESYRDEGFDYYAGELACSTDDVTQLTAEQFATLEAIEALLPAGAKAVAREHDCVLKASSREEDDKARVTRYSVLVTVPVGDLTVSREYAL